VLLDLVGEFGGTETQTSHQWLEPEWQKIKAITLEGEQKVTQITYLYWSLFSKK